MEDLFDSEIGRLSKKLSHQQELATRELLKVKFKNGIDMKKLEIEKTSLLEKLNLLSNKIEVIVKDEK